MAPAYGQQSVQHANAGTQRGANGHTVERGTHRPVQRQDQGDGRWPALIDRRTQGIQHPAHERRTYLDLGTHAQRRHRIAKANALGALDRHRQHIRAAKSNDLGQMRTAEPILNLAALANRAQRTCRFDGLAHRFEDLPAPAPGLAAAQTGKVPGQYGRGEQGHNRSFWPDVWPDAGGSGPAPTSALLAPTRSKKPRSISPS